MACGTRMIPFAPMPAPFGRVLHRKVGVTHCAKSRESVLARRMSRTKIRCRLELSPGDRANTTSDACHIEDV
jgi:hypothetical protein